MTVIINALPPEGRWEEHNGRYSLWWRPRNTRVERLVLVADKPYRIGDIVDIELRSGRTGEYLALSLATDDRPEYQLVATCYEDKSQGGRGGASYSTRLHIDAADWKLVLSERQSSGPRWTTHFVMAIAPVKATLQLYDSYRTTKGEEIGSGLVTFAEFNGQAAKTVTPVRELTLEDLLALDV